jgi:hypothetical protein
MRGDGVEPEVAKYEGGLWLLSGIQADGGVCCAPVIAGLAGT